MNVPAEIMQSAPAILDYGSNWFATHLEAAPGDFLWNLGSRALARLLFPSLREADPAELLKRIQRLEAGALGTEQALKWLSQQNPDHDIVDELHEPAAQEFVVGTLAAIMDSPSDDKRDLLGRFIAQRLYVATESPDELHLRQAEAMAERMNRQHLFALATLSLVHDTPLPEGLSRPEIHRWLDENLLPVKKIVAAVDPTYVELDYLASLGVVHYDRSDTRQALLLNSHAPAIEQNIFSATGDYPAPVEEYDYGEFYAWATELYEGRSPKHGPPRISLAPYILTPPGRRIASTIVERFLGARVANASRRVAEHKVIRPADRLGPMSET